MTTINITENITLTASEETVNTYTACVSRIDELLRWQRSAVEERDWEDYEDYDMEMGEYYDRIRNLNCV